MRSTFKILPYINRKRIKSDGTTAVLCRVSIDGKSILITTGIFCRPEDWNSQTGTIRQPRENNRLAEFRLNLERAYDRLLKEQGAVSAELLKKRRDRCGDHSPDPSQRRRSGAGTAQAACRTNPFDFHVPAVEDHAAQPATVPPVPWPGGHRLFRHHGGVRPFVQTVPEKRNWVMPPGM